MHLRALWLTLALSALAGFALLSGAQRGAYDFQAFYCAGNALRLHEDPYRAQPLGSCEHRQTDGTYAALPRGVVLPAPQPGYDIAAFALLSRLPFAQAKAVWGALLGAALAIVVVCTLAFTRASLITVLMAFGASLAMPSLAFGEFFAFYAAAACAAALFAQQGRWALAGTAAAATLAEPHLGIPICIALAIWNRAARVWIVVCAAALVTLSAAALGWAQNVEYVTKVLPFHALAEIASDAQLSFAAVLYASHVPEAPALRLALLSYAGCAALGIYAARILAQRFSNGAFLVAAPAAFAIIGGSFVHVTEVFAAIPLALLVLTGAPLRYRWAALTALVLLAVPWYTVLEGGDRTALTVLCALVAFSLVWENTARRAIPAAAAALLTFAALYYAPEWYAYAQGAGAPHISAIRIDPAYAQASWQAWIERDLSGSSAPTWALRAASWTGLLLLAALSGGIVSPLRRSRPSAR